MNLQDLIDPLCEKIGEAFDMAQRGGDRLLSVVVWPDGTATIRESVSRECGVGEYYQKVPYEQTVWTMPTRNMRVEDEDMDVAEVRAETIEYSAADVAQRIREWAEAGNLTVQTEN